MSRSDRTDETNALPAAAEHQRGQATPALVVALGASAGGLQALSTFFDHLPESDLNAYIVVTHQRSDHESLMAELLGRHTAIPVANAKDGDALERGHAYVAPPDGELRIEGGILHVVKAESRSPLPHAIDACFRSLAGDQRERAVCIVLSGNGSDGTLGVKAVKADGGMSIAQDPQTAAYGSMPASAIATGQVDHVLPPEEMAARLQGYAGTLDGAQRAAVPEDQVDKHLDRVMAILRGHTGHDFAHYKKSTMRRRVERRMKVHHFTELTEYIDLLGSNPVELDVLFRELLIGVTSFFRDPEAFEALQQNLPVLLRSKPADAPVRIWVPGCSTGEEAYSIAILLRECMADSEQRRPVQLFATDLDERAIDVARAGIYPSGIAADVGPERLERFFTPEEGGYRLRTDVREMVVFAVQNVISDPPFTRLDLLSCRNLLIYLDASVQKELVALFHYALNPNGMLFIGAAESLGGMSDAFEPLDTKWNVFRAREMDGRRRVRPNLPRTGVEGRRGAQDSGRRREHSMVEQAPKVLLDLLVPASVIVDPHGQILHIHGRTGAYLEPTPGQPTMNLFEMAREGLRVELMAAVRQVATGGKRVEHRGVAVKQNGGTGHVDVVAQKVTQPASMAGALLVSFHPAPAPEPERRDVDAPAPSRDGKSRVQDLETKLRDTKETLQSTIEQYETTHEELKTSNEELQSMNEELQSTNEELETAKEEQQSLNEELQTLNAELQDKIGNLSQAHDDMRNLLNSTQVASLFLDGELKIKRFTPQADRIANLLQTDVGRPISDLVTKLQYDGIDDDAREVLRTLHHVEREVPAKEGGWFLMRIMPYRTTDDVIDGVVITFVDIREMKRTEKRLEQERLFAQAIVRTVRSPLVVLDARFDVVSVNQAFCRLLNEGEEQLVGRSLFALGDGAWDLPALRRQLEKVLPVDTAFEDFRLEIALPAHGPKQMLVSGRRLENEETGEPARIFLAMEEDTDRS